MSTDIVPIAQDQGTQGGSSTSSSTYLAEQLASVEGVKDSLRQAFTDAAAEGEKKDMEMEDVRDEIRQLSEAMRSGKTMDQLITENAKLLINLRKLQQISEQQEREMVKMESEVIDLKAGLKFFKDIISPVRHVFRLRRRSSIDPLLGLREQSSSSRSCNP
jgi:chromosome segregation ATPase